MRLCIILFVILLAAPSATALDTAVDQGRVRELWTAQWTDADGTVREGVTGKGVVIMENEGFDATHPDMQDCLDPDHHAMGDVDSPRNDNDNHGNHIAGILCGNGANSGGELRGVAYGATLFSQRPFICTDGACDFRTWYEEPRLRAITNSDNANPIQDALSWGMPPDKDALFTQAVGNAGGDGSAATTEDYLHSDARLLGVAAANGYQDDVASYSSRGAKNDPSTWPDITAPACMYSIAAPPWADAHAASANNILLGEYFGSRDCPDWDPVLHGQRLIEGYSRHKGTSNASPFVAGVAALVFEVNPDLNATEAIYLLTRTADTFLPTDDTDGDGVVSRFEFWQQHGWEAGWGIVNATAAVAAAHYRLLHPEASLDEAVACSTTGSEDGQLVLNPADGCRLPVPGASPARTSSSPPEESGAVEPIDSDEPPERGDKRSPLTPWPVLVALTWGVLRRR